MCTGAIIPRSTYQRWISSRSSSCSRETYSFQPWTICKRLSDQLSNGEIITEGSLSRIALENTLSEPVNWHEILQAAALQLPETLKVVAALGFKNPIPPSLVQSSALQVVPLSDLQGSNSNGTIEPSSVDVLANGTSVNGSYNSTNGASLKEQAHEFQYPPHSIAVVGMAGSFG